MGNIVNNPKQSVAVKQMFLTRFIAVKPANAFCIYTVCVVIAETDGIFFSTFKSVSIKSSNCVLGKGVMFPV